LLSERVDPFEIPLRDDVRGIIREATVDDAGAWMRLCQPTLAQHRTSDAAWNWVEIVERARSQDGFLCLCVAREEGVEGLIELGTSVATRETSRRVPGAAMVYVEHLAVAPKNRPAPVGTGALRGVGSALLVVARDLARKLGYDGRVGLHSDPNAEEFYRRVGFTAGEREACTDGTWLYFEIAGDE
jgi:GNAT superfamily N-acetyltransferase